MEEMAFHGFQVVSNGFVAHAALVAMHVNDRTSHLVHIMSSHVQHGSGTAQTRRCFGFDPSVALWSDRTYAYGDRSPEHMLHAHTLAPTLAPYLDMEELSIFAGVLRW